MSSIWYDTMMCCIKYRVQYKVQYNVQYNVLSSYDDNTGTGDSLILAHKPEFRIFVAKLSS